MASHRHDRLTEDIRRELTDIFRMLKDPRITGMISIVKVDLSGDQSYCKVYISSLDGLEAANRAVEGLKSAAGFIRREIGSRLQKRYPDFDVRSYGTNLLSKLLDEFVIELSENPPAASRVEEVTL